MCVNPEFLREGSAIHDYYNPSYILIGADDTHSADVVQSLYKQLDAPVIRTSLRTAEMAKYASNAFHALKITFANEIGSLCKEEGIDGREIMMWCVKIMSSIFLQNILRQGLPSADRAFPRISVRSFIARSKLMSIARLSNLFSKAMSDTCVARSSSSRGPAITASAFSG